jgi:hypothetical protein
MLRHRQQFDMGEAHVDGIDRKLFGQFAVRQPVLAVLTFASPRTEMDFVNGHRCIECIDIVARRRGARQRGGIEDNRCRGGPHFRAKSDRVGLERQQFAGSAQDFIFVFVSGARARHEDFPIAVAAHPHDVAAAVPDIEVADDADPLRIGGPYDEGNS